MDRQAESSRQARSSQQAEVGNGEADGQVGSRGQRSEQTDRGWVAGVRELAGSLLKQDSRGNALWRSRDNLAVTDWEERTYIEGAQVKVVGLIRGAQGGRQVNGKTRGGP